jgi:hypothetical protein
LVKECVYVLGLDHVAAARAIVGEYKNYLENDKDLAYGFRYLEKLVDNEYELGASEKLECMAIQVLHLGDAKYGNCQSIRELAEQISIQSSVVIAQMEALLELQCLRTPRTMLKIITKFTRVIEALNSRYSDVERNSLANYPFWILFMISMYYWLHPDELSRFVAGEFSIYQLMQGETNTKTRGDQNGSSQTSPLADFEGFASRFITLTNKQVKIPSPEQRRLLARLIHQS